MRNSQNIPDTKQLKQISKTTPEKNLMRFPTLETEKELTNKCALLLELGNKKCFCGGKTFLSPQTYFFKVKLNFEMIMKYYSPLTCVQLSVSCTRI